MDERICNPHRRRDPAAPGKNPAAHRLAHLLPQHTCALDRSGEEDRR
jgi:hypothetical protein